MFRLFATIVLLTVLAQGARSQEAVPNALVPGAKPTDHGSYTVGFDIGRDLAGAGFLPTDCSPRDFIQGVMDAISKQNSKLSDAEIEAALLKIRTNLETRRAENKKKNLETANAFFEANKKKLGVVALPSGLQYLVIKTGNGAQAKLTNRVKCHYEGTLLNGKIFDSSIKRGEPAEFAVTEVIDGWKEAISKMRVGDKWKLFIPPNLGYLDRGTPDGAIGPNEALIFEMELLGVL